MGQKWEIRAYRDGDEEGLLDLWKNIFPNRQLDRDSWLKWWHWTYKENPAGKSWIWLAVDGNKIVGHEAVRPVRLKVGKEVQVGFQSIDSMTHPDYRHQGIYYTLAKKAYEEAAKDNVHIGYGFSNENSYPIAINKLNWLEMPNLKDMVKVFNWRNAFKFKTKNKFAQIVLAVGADIIFNKLFFMMRKAPSVTDLTFRHITEFDERFDEFWNAVSMQAQIMTVRNMAYLNWRYHPPDMNFSIIAAEKDNKICGYIVLQNKNEQGKKVSIIFDLISQSEEIMHCLLSRALEECRQASIDIIYYSSITNKTYRKILRRNGFFSLPFSKGEYFSIYSSSPSIPKDFLTNSQNWLVSTGDSD